MKNGIVFCMIMMMATTAWSVEIETSPEDFHDDQASASSGDTLVMAEGVYYASTYDDPAGWATIAPEGRNIIYTSEDPDDPECVAATIISGLGWTDETPSYLEAYDGGCCFFSNGETSSCQLIGLTIMRGLLEGEGPCDGVVDDASAVVCIDSSPTISKCRIIGGYCGKDVGGIYCEDSSAVIEKCEILSAEFVSGYAPIHVTTDTGQSSVTIQDCTIAGNIDYSFAGGIVCRDSASVLVTHCRIFDNSGTDTGGIYFSGSTGTIRNCEIVGNKSTDDDGKGGISVYSGSVAIENCTIAENVAGGYLGCGGGIFLEEWGVVDLNNTILWRNIACDEGEQMYNWGGTADINHCDIQDSYTSGGYVYDDTDELLGDDKGGNIDVDPQFVADGNWSGNCPDLEEWTAGDYHLTTDSTACIDAGDDSVVDWDYDIDGEPRVIGDHVDIGADEYPFIGDECFPAYYTTYEDWLAFDEPDCWCEPYQCDGDADGETEGFLKRRVWDNDYALLQANWGKLITDPTLDPCADFDHKGAGVLKRRVWDLDYDILSTNWGLKDSDLPGDCPREE